MQQTTVNRTAFLIISMITSFFNPFMGAAVNVALPKISDTLQLNAITMSWVSMAFLLASAVSLVPAAKIADIYGRKKMFFYGNIVFTLATLSCGLAFSDYFLISSRVLQGIGSAMMFSTSMAILISIYPPEQRGKIIGFNVSAVYVGLSIAPVLGGFLTQTLGWRSLFLITSALSMGTVLATYFSVKTEWIEARNEKFDWLGTLIYVPAMVMLMFGFSKLPANYAILLTILGIVGLVAFVKVELRFPYPVFYVKLFFENKVFASSGLSAFINYAATFAVSFVLSLYLQYAKHMSPKEAGLVLIAQPVVMATVAVFAGRLSDKINPRWLASAGMAVSVIGLAMLSIITTQTTLPFIIAALAVLGLGFGLFSSPNTNMVMSSVERKYYSLASAMVSTMRSTGMMFSMAIASLAVHLFVGAQKISESNIDNFVKSSKVIFLIFTVLCIIGVFTSLVGKKSTTK